MVDDNEQAVFKPPVPKMGGICQVEAKKYAAWTGGKPKADWTGLANEKADYTTPLQLRHMKDSAEYQQRSSGLTTKFSKQDGDLDQLQRDLRKAFEERGIDTICYLPDPFAAQGSNETLLILEEHTRYTKEKVDEYGIDAVVNKPFQMQRILSTVIDVMERTEARFPA